MERFYPGLLCQVLCGFGIFDASQNVRIEAGLVCSDKWGKRFGVAVLGARDKLFFIGIKQSRVFLSVDYGLRVSRYLNRKRMCLQASCIGLSFDSPARCIVNRDLADF